MSGPVSRVSADRCSRWRKTALRELSRQFRGEYRLLYDSHRAQGYTIDQSKGRARTILGKKYPGTYGRLYEEAKRNETCHRHESES